MKGTALQAKLHVTLNYKSNNSLLMTTNSSGGGSDTCTYPAEEVVVLIPLEHRMSKTVTAYTVTHGTYTLDEVTKVPSPRCICMFVC